MGRQRGRMMRMTDVFSLTRTAASNRSASDRVGRPRVTVDRLRVAELRAEGRGWKAIAAEMGAHLGTILRATPQSE
jgi:hypothetical protein